MKKNVSQNFYNLDMKYDTIYKTQQFPYKISIILKNSDIKINHEGGGFNESDPILYFLHNLKYNIIETLPITKKNCETYKFEIDKELNQNMKYDSQFIASGYNSTAISIKYIKDTLEIECNRENNDEPVLNKLVLKCKFIKKNTREKMQNDFYMLYRRRKNSKSKLGVSIPECYFYGNDIIKEKYVPEIINEECDKPEMYDELFKNSFLEFSIWKYYTQKLLLIKKKYVLLKLSTYLYYVNEIRCYINDLKFDNIGFDEDNDYNIINIDYDNFLFGQYKTFDNDKYIIWPEFTLAYFFSCDVKKRLYLLLNPDSMEFNNKIEELICNNNKIYSDEPDDDYMQKFSEAVFKILCYVTGAKLTYHKNMKTRYLIDIDLQFEKFNITAIIDTILCLFFKEVKIGGLIFNTLPDNIRLNPLLIKDDHSIISDISTFHNLNDVKILTYFIHEYIQPVEDVEKDYIDELKSLMFDPITETGLLGTDFESVPPYELIAKKFKELNCDDMNIYEQFKKMIDNNIGTKKVLRRTVGDYERKIKEDFKITNVGFDVKKLLTSLELLHEDFDMITYEEFQFANLVERLMDRPDNRSDTSLDLPCVNSTLPQNYIFTIDNETCEEKKTIKWIKNYMGKYIESKEYEQIKKDISLNKCYVKKSNRQIKYDNTEMRKFAMCIVNFLKGEKIISDGLSKKNLEIVEILKRLNRKDYLGLFEKSRPAKKGEYYKSYPYEELLREIKKERLSDEQYLELSKRIRSFEREKHGKKEEYDKTWSRAQPQSGKIQSRAQPQSGKTWARAQPQSKDIWPRGQPLQQNEESKLKEQDERNKYLKYKMKYLELKNKIKYLNNK